MYSRILCPIDFSETSERALRYAAAFAGWHHASLEVLHAVPADEAWPTFDPARPAGQTARPPAARPAEDSLDQMRQSIARAGAAGCDPQLSQEDGRAHEVIVRRAAAHPGTLLVMGTHGRSGFSRLFLGSVTEKVVRTAPCPVLTVPPHAPAAPAAPVTLRRILCPIDYSPSALKALEHALDLGRQTAGHVTVLHALEYLDPHDPPAYVDPDIRRRHQQFIDDARARLHEEVGRRRIDGCEVEEAVALNRAYREILQRAASGIDIIVMGAQGHGAVEGMLYGSTTQHVVRAAPCPVLTVRA